MRTVFIPNNEVIFQKAWQRLYDAGIPSIPPYAFLPWQMMPSTNTLLPWRRLWFFEPVFRLQRTIQMFGELHICLDWQYNDAVNLLKDPNYIIENPADLDKFEQLLAQIADEYSDIIKYTEDTIFNGIFSAVALSGVGYGFNKIISN